MWDKSTPVLSCEHIVIFLNLMLLELLITMNKKKASAYSQVKKASLFYFLCFVGEGAVLY